MKVRVLLFAAYREAAGVSSLEVELSDEATASDLFDLLEASYSGLRVLRPYTSFAVNREVVDGRLRLKPGDEVAFLQPVSGG
ncbi:MAG: MoaD/ThiS family protein [Chloroflexota bacterium]